jgi:hypothetical protein
VKIAPKREQSCEKVVKSVRDTFAPDSPTGRLRINSTHSHAAPSNIRDAAASEKNRLSWRTPPPTIRAAPGLLTSPSAALADDERRWRKAFGGEHNAAHAARQDFGGGRR